MEMVTFKLKKKTYKVLMGHELREPLGYQVWAADTDSEVISICFPKRQQL